MSSAAIMDAVVSKIKTVLSEAEEVLASRVTPEKAEEMRPSWTFSSPLNCSTIANDDTRRWATSALRPTNDNVSKS